MGFIGTLQKSRFWWVKVVESWNEEHLPRPNAVSGFGVYASGFIELL